MYIQIVKKADPLITVEHLINAGVLKVWQAITKVEHMRNWFFENIPSFEAEVGFETRFTVTSEERSFPHIWKITDVREHNKITFNWKYEGYDGDSFVHFELFPKAGKTLIRLTTEVIEDFPSNIPEFKRESCIEGWNYFIKERLPQYVDSI